MIRSQQQVGNMHEYTDEVKWAGAQQTVMLDWVARWASINTGSYNVSGLLRLADVLQQELNTFDGETSWIELEPAVTIDDAGRQIERPLGPAIWLRSNVGVRPRILLNIHYDTVYAPEHPFSQVWEDGPLLRGPGVVDAKGGLAIMLTAARALQRSDVAHRVGLDMLITPDEEIGSPGSTRLLHRVGRACDVGLVFEPRLPDGALVAARGGSGNFTFVVRGRSVHAGRDFEKGRNAVTAMAALMLALDQLNGREAGMTVNVANVRGGGPANVVPDCCVCRVNVRIARREQGDAYEAAAAEIVAGINSRDGISAEMFGSFYAPPKPIFPGIATLMDHIAHCSHDLDMPVAWKNSGGVSDGNRLANVGLPVVDTLGPRGDGLHSDHEHLVIESLGQHAQLATLLLLRLADGSLPMPARGEDHESD